MFNKRKMYSLIIIIVLCFSAGILIDSAMAISVGGTIRNIKLQMANEEGTEMWIPHIGKKVVSIFYTDPDVKDVNEPLTEFLKSKYKSERAYYVGVGIANCKDTWIPNGIILSSAKSKAAKYKSTVLLDREHYCKKYWGLGDCNGKGVVIIVGHDKKVLFWKKVSTEGESSAIKSQVAAAIDKGIAAMKSDKPKESTESKSKSKKKK